MIDNYEERRSGPDFDTKPLVGNFTPLSLLSSDISMKFPVAFSAQKQFLSPPSMN